MKLRSDKGLGKYEAQLDLLTRHLEDLTSWSSIDPNLVRNLSVAEIRIASLVKNGVNTEEIARQLHISLNTVRSHSRNIRKKLKIDGQYSLRDFLSSLSATSSRQRMPASLTGSVSASRRSYPALTTTDSS